MWHREEEPLNHHETPGRQIKQSNQPKQMFKLIDKKIIAILLKLFLLNWPYTYVLALLFLRIFFYV